MRQVRSGLSTFWRPRKHYPFIFDLPVPVGRVFLVGSDVEGSDLDLVGVVVGGRAYEFECFARVDDVVDDEQTFGADIERCKRLRPFDELGSRFEPVILIVVVLDSNGLDKSDVEHVRQHCGWYQAAARDAEDGGGLPIAGEDGFAEGVDAFDVVDPRCGEWAVSVGRGHQTGIFSLPRRFDHDVDNQMRNGL